jgi:3-hydroxyisobutyrate dehydrogenase-like beta-hydroxyacid dehydrogenase
MFSRDFETVNFRLELVYKDLKQAAAMAREIGVPLFATNGAVELLHLAKISGFGDQDGSAVVRGLEKLLGVEVRGEVKKPG